MTRDELAQPIHDKGRRIHQGVVGLREEPSLDEMGSAFSQRPPNHVPSVQDIKRGRRMWTKKKERDSFMGWEWK